MTRKCFAIIISLQFVGLKSEHFLPLIHADRDYNHYEASTNMPPLVLKGSVQNCSKTLQIDYTTAESQSPLHRTFINIPNFDDDIKGTAEPKVDRDHPCTDSVNHVRQSFVSACDKSSINKIISVQLGIRIELYACILRTVEMPKKAQWFQKFYHGDSIAARAMPRKFHSSSFHHSDDIYSKGVNISSKNPWRSTYVIDFDHGRVSRVGLSHSCYSGDVTFFENGVFDITAQHEYANYDWNADSSKDLKVPMMLPLKSLVSVEVVNIGRPDRISIAPSVKQRSTPQSILREVGESDTALPLCISGDSVGRWIDGQWTPVHCRMQRNWVSNFPQCAAKYCNSVTWAGDSNSRRLLKSLNVQPGKQRWCSNGRNSRACQCEDGEDGFGMLTSGISFTFVHGLVEMGSALSFIKSIDINTRVLIIGHIVTWDAAFSTIDTYRQALPKFIHALQDRLALFSTPPILIVRLGVHYCCAALAQATATTLPAEGSGRSHRAARGQSRTQAQTSMTNFRMFSRLRILAYNELLVYYMRKAFPSVRLWDAYTLGAARPLAAARRQAERCEANHYDSEVVEADLDILLNMICND